MWSRRYISTYAKQERSVGGEHCVAKERVLRRCEYSGSDDVIVLLRTKQQGQEQIYWITWKVFLGLIGWVGVGIGARYMGIVSIAEVDRSDSGPRVIHLLLSQASAQLAQVAPGNQLKELTVIRPETKGNYSRIQRAGGRFVHGLVSMCQTKGVPLIPMRSAMPHNFEKALVDLRSQASAPLA
ncbi:hypothetical protein Tco_0998303 [Tanacetum coccineum]